MDINTELLIDFLNGRTGEEIQRQIEQWYFASEENKKNLEQFYFILFLNERLQVEKKIDVEKSLKELKSRINLKEKTVHLPDSKPKGWTFYWKQIAVIAAMIGIILAGGITLKKTLEKLEQPFIVATRLGERSNVILPDRTRVWLNSCSRIEYTSSLFSGKRKVNLSGEAYFEVREDKNAPFIVNSKNISATVLGTKFNIRANRDDSQIIATLLEGSILVSVKNLPEKKCVKMTPDQQLIYNCNTGKIDLSECFSAPDYTSWIDNKLYFEKTGLLEITKSLERYYNVHFVFASEDIKQETFTCDFQTNENIYQILSILKLTGKFNFKVEERTITLSAKPL
jgi:ferric-dicitrate binding protein FerR (iron transport regulator)